MLLKQNGVANVHDALIYTEITTTATETKQRDKEN
jgi:hypothetical protein